MEVDVLVNSAWSYGTVPVLSKVQADMMSRMLGVHKFAMPSYIDQLTAQHWQVQEPLGWSPEFAGIAPGFLPSQAVMDAMGHSLVTSNLVWQNQLEQILSSQLSLVGLAARTNIAPIFQTLSDTLARYGSVQTILGSLVSDTGRSTQSLRGYSAPPGLRYDTFLDRLPRRPSPRRVAVAQHAGDVQSGLLVVEALTAPDLHEDEATDLAEEFTAVVLEPWREAPGRLRDALLGKLQELDPELPEFLMGGWSEVDRAGPAAASKIAHCAAELISRTLRALAPAPEVIAWTHAVHPREGGMLTDRGDPTRRARVRYALRERPKRDRRLVEVQIDTLTRLFTYTNDVLQPIKHERTVPITIAAIHLQTAENAVSLLISQLE